MFPVRETVWASCSVLEGIELEADRAFPYETGGVLAGYTSEKGIPVICAFTGPGPNARHYLTHFEPDHDWQCEQLDEIYLKSSGVMTYLGDWHTHPNGLAKMSRIDKKTLLRIAEHREAQCDFPLMMIGGGCSRSWLWACHRYLGRNMWELRPKYRRANLKTFDPD